MTALLPLEVKDISKKFENKTVLNQISLSVNPGEIFGLVGVNGVDKTTLIKIILQLLRQTSGSVQFFGNDASNPASRAQLAYLPEKFYPANLLKGKEFLALAMAYHGKTLDLDAAKQKAAILGLDPEVLEHRIGRYSKGMGQKLGLLSVFLVDTPLLLLDEPMSGLDPSARIQLKTLLTSYKKAGNSVFFSSHILADIEEICDRMAVIHDGHIIYHGTPEMFLKTYKETGLEKAFLKAIA